MIEPFDIRFNLGVNTTEYNKAIILIDRYTYTYYMKSIIFI